MKIKILKSAGVIVKDDVMVIQVGKVIETNRSLANHLIKNGLAEVFEDTQEEVPQEEPTETPQEDVDENKEEETEVE